jgi:tetratricopeptide (TPR) repeat protein
MPRLSIATCCLALVAILAPLMTQGQVGDNVGSASLQGSVRDAKGHAVAGAAVSLYLKDGTQTVSALSDAAGRYHFAGLGEGIYMLRVNADESKDATFGPCVLGATEAKTLDLTIESSQRPKSQTSSTSGPAAGSPQFFDEPQFTVAGVTDATNLGGHGSNTVVRTKESLARDIVSLGVADKPSAVKPAVSSVNPGEASLRAMVEKQPGSFENNHRLGKLLIDNGKVAEALPYLERASQLKPADYENAYLLALAYGDVGQYGRARTNAQALLAVQPQPGQGGTPFDQAKLHHLLGDAEENLGDPLTAVQQYQRAAELDPSETNFFDWGAELLLHRAVEPAIEVFSRGNRLFPRSARMLIALGVARYSNGSYDQAAQCLCEASDLNPGDPQPYLFLGKLQTVETNQSECSTTRLERFVKLQPENALASYYYGVNLWKRRKGPDDSETSQQAESNLKRAVQLDPTLGIGYLQLGVLYGERKDFPAAVSSYEKAIEASPQLEEAHYRLSQAYRRTGEKSKAERELRLYDQIAKKKDEEVERERRESRQFVYTLRTPASATQSR